MLISRGFTVFPLTERGGIQLWCEMKITVGSAEHTVDAEGGVSLLDLPRLNLGQSVDRRQTRVLGQSERDILQSVCERAERVLLQRGDLKPQRIIINKTKINLRVIQELSFPSSVITGTSYEEC